MEGLIPFVLKALKKNKLHKSLSDGSRRSYHLLLSAGAGDSFSGSSHRRTQSEFQPPSSMSFENGESTQPEPEEVFFRCGSLNGDFRAPDPTTGNRVGQTRARGNKNLERDAVHQKWR